MKVLYLYPGSSSPVAHFEKRLIETINAENPTIKIDYWDWTTQYLLGKNPDLEWTNQNKDKMYEFYKELKRRSEDFDVVFIAQTGGILPELISELKPLTVYNTADDPESSHKCSFPFLKSADVILHAGVNYDLDTKMGVEFQRRGARRCYLFPIGFYDEMFPEIKDFDDQFHKRDIQLIHVGYPKQGKLEKVFRHFGHQVNVHCRRLNYKHKIYWLLFGRKWISPFSGDLASLYRRCQVGINTHYTFGPSNVRTYQLNSSGVAQVLDCSEGRDEIFCTGKEIVGYDTVSEAIQQIELLIMDDEKRYKIAKSGYDRCRNDYNRKNPMVKMLKSL